MGMHSLYPFRIYSVRLSCMRNLTVTIIAIGMCFAATGVSAEQTDLCQVSGPIKTIYGKDGPLPGCRKGDTAHFQIDHTLVAPATDAGKNGPGGPCSSNTRSPLDVENSLFSTVCPVSSTHSELVANAECQKIRTHTLRRNQPVHTGSMMDTGDYRYILKPAHAPLQFKQSQ